METILLFYVIGVIIAAILYKEDLKNGFLDKGSAYPDEFIWNYILINPKKELFYSWWTVVRQVIYRSQKNND